MNKKQNTWVFAIFALAVIILLVGSIGASVTGHGIFDWLRRDRVQVQEQTQLEDGEIYRGLLGQKYLESEGNLEYLKGYEAKYDENGWLVYEIINNMVLPGEAYDLVKEEFTQELKFVSSSGGTVYTVPWGSTMTFPGKCTCLDNPPQTGNIDCRRNPGAPWKCIPRSNSVCKECGKEANT